MRQEVARGCAAPVIRVAIARDFDKSRQRHRHGAVARRDVVIFQAFGLEATPMLRIIAGIIVGWIVMAIMVMAAFAIAWLALGTEGTFQSGSYWTTNTFNIAVLAGGTIAAIVGGLLCVVIARNGKAAFALAAIVMAVGIGGAVMEMNKPDPPARTGAITMQDVATHGKEPMWFAFGTPILAGLGIAIGSGLGSGLGRRKPAAGRG
jgi:hypothetical protein